MTPRTTERSTIDGAAGALEVVCNVPDTPLSGIALIAHPHPLQGGTLDNKVVQTLAKTFFSLGYAPYASTFAASAPRPASSPTASARPTTR